MGSMELSAARPGGASGAVSALNGGAPQARASLDQVARDLEASFLAVMLDAAGVGKPRDTFGGGAGEEQFGSFLTREYARAVVDKGGIGLAEAIFEQLKEDLP